MNTPRNRQKMVEPAVNRIHSVQSFSIQHPTLKTRIYQMLLAIAFVFATAEVYATVNVSSPMAYSQNKMLIAASGYRNNGSGGLSNVGSNGNYWSFAPNSQTNARNLNFNSGNVNPLNNNNRANGFSVRPAKELGVVACSYFKKKASDMNYSISDIHSLVTRAYLKAREEERGTDAQVEFELNLEGNIRDIELELYRRVWWPQPLDWFVIVEPTVREVFAPKFRDRVVSHVLFMLISPIFERYFVFDSFSCRKGKGTLVGIERLEHHIRSVTNNYTNDAWSLNYDIRAYFMSIVRERLFYIIDDTLVKNQLRQPELIDYDFARWLVATILSRDPLEGCVYHGNPNLIKLIQPGKSLRDQEPGVGIPIGDVMNQLCSNIYLNEFDQYVKRELHIRNSVRYVDDGKMLHQSRTYLEDCWCLAEKFLKERLALTLNPNKTTITNVYDTIYFLGSALKPYRRHARNETVERFKKYIEDANINLAEGTVAPKHVLSNINSRLGYFSHFDEWRMIHKALEDAPYITKYFDFTPDLKKAIIKH